MRAESSIPIVTIAVMMMIQATPIAVTTPVEGSAPASKSRIE